MFLVSSMVFLSSDTCRRNEAPQWPGNREQQLETERRASGVRWRTFLAASISISKSPPLSSLILSFIVLRPGPRALSFGFVRAKGYAAVYQARLPTRQRAFAPSILGEPASTSSEAVLHLLGTPCPSQYAK